MDFRGGVVGGSKMEEGAGIWEQLKERFWGGACCQRGKKGEERKNGGWGSKTNGCWRARSRARVDRKEAGLMVL